MLTRAIDDLVTWIERHARPLFQVTLLGSVAVAAWFRLANFGDVKARSPDERVYAAFAHQLAAGGLAAYRDIFASYAADPGQWAYPSPTRMLHVVSFAGVMKLTGSDSARAGAAVSLVLSLGSVVLLARFAVRHFNRFVAALAAFFLATQFAELEFARRAWGEATASFMSLLVLYAACSLDQNFARWRPRLAFLAAGVGCLLTKETSAIAFSLCGAWLLGGRLRARDYRAATLVFAGGALSGAVSLAALWLAAGDLNIALDGLWRGASRGSSEWGKQNASGSWHEFPRLLLSIGPATAVLALLGLGVLAVARPTSRSRDGVSGTAFRAGRLAALLTLGFVLACSFGPGLQYLRMMAPANPSYCLLAAVGARWLLLESEDWQRGAFYPAVVLALPFVLGSSALRDYGMYVDVVVRSGMQDMTARWVLERAKRRDDAPRDAPLDAPSGAPLDRTSQALSARSEPNPDARPEPQPGLAEHHLNRSLEHCRAQRYAECVNSARAALSSSPRLAEAWNNAAAGYAGMGLWDDAVQCARQALELRPNFQLAQNNLAWATQQKARALSGHGR